MKAGVKAAGFALAAAILVSIGFFAAQLIDFEISDASSAADEPSSSSEPEPTPESSLAPSRESAPPPPGSSSAGESLPQEQPTSSAPPLTKKLVVPEGYTLARIGMTLEEMDVCTAQEFISASQNGDFSGFSLIAAQEQKDERCFRLEGYLFPDTYEIYSNDSPDAIIRRMLSHAEQKLNADIRAQIASSGYTADEIITMASIIEKEAFGAKPMRDLSSVLHNRLDIKMRLQCDVTITYVEGAIKPFITGDKDRYNSHYNTYKCPALPAGAICNPGLEAIKAALSPSDTDYLFFVTDAAGNYYFSETWEEHDAKVKELKSEA